MPLELKSAFKGKTVYLPMDEDNRAQETPGSSLPVHMEHSQDLQETNPSWEKKALKCFSFAQSKNMFRLNVFVSNSTTKALV